MRFRSQGENAEHRIDGPAPSFHAGSLLGPDASQLEFQHVCRFCQGRSEGLGPFLHQEVAGIEPLGQAGHLQFQVVLDKDFQGAIDATRAAGVGVKHQDDARHQPAKLLHVPLVQGRAHGGHHMGYAHLVGHQDVGVALDHGQVTGIQSGLAGLVDAVQLVALAEQYRFSRVVVFGRGGGFRGRRQNAAAEAHRLSAAVANRKNHPVAKAVVVAVALISFGDQAELIQVVGGQSGLGGLLRQPFSLGRGETEAEAAHCFTRELALAQVNPGGLSLGRLQQALLKLPGRPPHHLKHRGARLGVPGT